MFLTAGRYNDTWEVFDSMTRKFTLIICEIVFKKFEARESSACCFGNGVLLLNIFSDNTHQYILYDTENETFSVKIYS